MTDSELAGTIWERMAGESHHITADDNLDLQLLQSLFSKAGIFYFSILHNL